METERRQTQTGGRDAVLGYIEGDVALSVGMPKALPPKGFRWRPLSDLARLESGHTPSRKVEEYWDDGDIPWVTVKHAAAHHGQTLYATEEYITEIGELHSSARLLPANTVCLTRTGSLGFVVVMGIPMCTSQGLVNWVCGPEIDYRYLKYILLAESGSFHRFSWGSAHQTIYFPEVKAFHVLLPELEEQIAIAGVLGALDDKIESNRHQQSILLNICHAVFDSAITSGGELMKVDEIVRFRNNERKPLSAMQRAGMERRFPYYGATGIFDYVDGYLFDDVNVLIGEDGSVVNDDGTPVTQMAWGKYWVNNHAHVLSGKAVSTELAYIALARSDVRPLITGAVQLKINMGNLKSLEITMPSVEVRGDVDRQVQENLALWRSKSDESKRLADLRDVLLPELLSGRLRVKDASSMVESV